MYCTGMVVTSHISACHPIHCCDYDEARTGVGLFAIGCTNNVEELVIYVLGGGGGGVAGYAAAAVYRSRTIFFTAVVAAQRRG